MRDCADRMKFSCALDSEPCNNFFDLVGTCNFICSTQTCSAKVDESLQSINDDEKKTGISASMKVPYEPTHKCRNMQFPTSEYYETMSGGYNDQQIIDDHLLETDEDTLNSSKAEKKCSRNSFTSSESTSIIPIKNVEFQPRYTKPKRCKKPSTPKHSITSSEPTTVINFENVTLSAVKSINARSAIATDSKVLSRSCSSQEAETLIRIENKNICHKNSMGSKCNKHPNTNRQICTHKESMVSERDTYLNQNFQMGTYPEDAKRSNGIQIDNTEVQARYTRPKQCKELSAQKHSIASSEAKIVTNSEDETLSAVQTINTCSTRGTNSMVLSRRGSRQGTETLVGIKNKSICHTKSMGSEGDTHPNPNSQIGSHQEDAKRSYVNPIENVEFQARYTKPKRCTKPSAPKLTGESLYCDAVQKQIRLAAMMSNNQHRLPQFSLLTESGSDVITLDSIEQAEKIDSFAKVEEKYDFLIDKMKINQIPVNNLCRSRPTRHINTITIQSSKILGDFEKHEPCVEVLGPQRARDRIRTYTVKKNQLEAKRVKKMICMNTLEVQKKRRLEALRILERKRHLQQIQCFSKGPSSLPSEYDASPTKYGGRLNKINEHSKNKTRKRKGMRTKVSPDTAASSFSGKHVYSNRFELLYSFSKAKQIAGKERRENIMRGLKTNKVADLPRTTTSLSNAVRNSKRMYDQAIKQRVALERRRRERKNL